jgi:excisionase family DNA binding protein
MTDFLTFEEAASMLNVSHSTLYRWLREDKVPGHKAGRQWRFERAELEAFMRSDDSDVQSALAPIRNYLESSRNEEGPMDIDISRSPAKLAESLLWDAADRGASVVHFQPDGPGHQLRYRTGDGLEKVVEVPEGTLEVLDEQWRRGSKPMRSEDHRRLFLEREDDGAARLQVRYQKLETLQGERLTLRLLPEDKSDVGIEDIASGDDAERLHWVCEQSHGLMLVSGRSGSGKTTTTYACLSELADSGDRVIFTLEEMAGYFIPGVNQIEVDLSDDEAFRHAFSAMFESDPDVIFIASSLSSYHRSMVWNSALRAAESGHLVFVQMEAESAEDARERFVETVDRPVDDYLLASCWQELDTDEDGHRFARYEWTPSSGPSSDS